MLGDCCLLSILATLKLSFILASNNIIDILGLAELKAGGVRITTAVLSEWIAITFDSSEKVKKNSDFISYMYTNKKKVNLQLVVGYTMIISGP